jgi:hypothetical protein
MWSIALVIGLLSFAAPAAMAAGYPNITYTAAGIIGNPISGSDTFRLAGQPFSISITANDSQLSSYHGPTYAGYVNLYLTGTIASQLVSEPIAISSHAAWIVMANGNPSSDSFTMGSQVKVIGVSFNFSAQVTLPKGTLTTVRNHAFPPAALTLTTATMTYTAGGAPTTLGLIGTLSGTAAAASATRAGAAVAGSLDPPDAILPRMRPALMIG